MQSLVRRSGCAVGGVSASLRSSAPSATRGLHSLSHRLSSAGKGKPGAPANGNANGPKKMTANSAADLRRIFREQQRASFVASEAFPWEITEQKVTAWEPKYEDEKKFYYASKVEQDKHNLDGSTLRRYLDGYGSKYLLSKHALRSGAALPEIKMTSPSRLQVELVAPSSILNYWFLQMTASQRPKNTVKAQLEMARIKSKEKQILKVRMSQRTLYDYLVSLHELWPRKDERDYAWATIPRREHGQYRLTLSRVLAEGASKPLNKATQSFIDHLQYQVGFHFRESQKQNRNMHWLQFLGVPGLKVSKKWGGEIKVPKLRSRED